MLKKRKCLCCGNEYDYCPNCSKSSTPWKFNYDTEACKELFNIISAYNMNLVKENRVIDILNKYSIVDFSIYRDNIKEVLSKITKGQKKNILESIVDNTIGESINESIAESIVNKEVITNKEDQSITTEMINEEIVEETPRRRRNRYFD